REARARLQLLVQPVVLVRLALGVPARPAREPVVGSRARRREDQQLVAHVQALKPSCVAFGADGEPMTLLFASISCICSELTRPAFAPFVVADVNAGSVRFGSAAKPASVPSRSGVSSIHSAVRWVDGYGTVVENDSPRVTSWSTIDQRFVPGMISAIDACM